MKTEEENRFIDAVTISPGYSTLEWVLPNPPTFHTFEELAVMKQPPFVKPGELFGGH